MAITPRFSAQRLTRTLSAATGMAAGALKNTLSRFGKQGMLQEGTTAAEAKVVLRQLEKSGAIEDARAAEKIFARENRVAERVAKVTDQARREANLAQYQKEQAMGGGVVRQQAHKVSAFESAGGGTEHKVSVFGGTNHVVSAGSTTTTKTSAGMTGTSPLQMAKPAEIPKPQIKDIPFD